MIRMKRGNGFLDGYLQGKRFDFDLLIGLDFAAPDEDGEPVKSVKWHERKRYRTEQRAFKRNGIGWLYLYSSPCSQFREFHIAHELQNIENG